MVKNLVSSVSVAASVDVLSAVVVSLVSELGDEQAVKPKVTLNIADNNKGDFREFSMALILEMIGLS